MSRPSLQVNGVLVVDKQQEWTSHDVCAFLRSRFRIKKVGHAGTLDPLATGVLVLLLGSATKLAQTFSSCDKAYFGTLRLGLQTDSQDITGKVLEERDWTGVSNSSIEEAFQTFLGEIEQIPPMVSALKRDGVRLYKLARAGKTVDRLPRKVTIQEFRIEAIQLPEIRFYARVSKGTYLRTLVNDLGERLGTFATLSELRRVKSGAFSIEDATTIAELKKMEPADLLSRVIDPTAASRV